MRITETEIMEVETTAGGHLPPVPLWNSPLFRMMAVSVLLHAMVLGFLFLTAVNPIPTTADRQTLPVIHVTLSPPGATRALKEDRLPPVPLKRETAVHGSGDLPGAAPAPKDTLFEVRNKNRASREDEESGMTAVSAMAIPASPQQKESTASGDALQEKPVSAPSGGGHLPETAGDSLPVRPRYLDTPSPVYPAEARSLGYEGTTLLTVEVLSSGRVGQVLVKKSSGHAVLDRSALRAVRSWRFEPARIRRIPKTMTVDIPIRFSLEGQR